jgi:hypothetical protein
MTDIATDDPASLSNTNLLKAYLINRSAYGESLPWQSEGERDARAARGVAISRELRSRSLPTPSGQSIGRQSDSSLTEADQADWEAAVLAWNGVDPAPKGSDVLPQN